MFYKVQLAQGQLTKRFHKDRMKKCSFPKPQEVYTVLYALLYHPNPSRVPPGE